MLLDELFVPNTVKLPPMVSGEEGTKTNRMHLAGPVADMKAQKKNHPRSAENTTCKCSFATENN